MNNSNNNQVNNHESLISPARFNTKKPSNGMAYGPFRCEEVFLFTSIFHRVCSHNRNDVSLYLDYHTSYR